MPSPLETLLGYKQGASFGDRLGGIAQSPLLWSSLGLLAGQNPKEQLQLAMQGAQQGLSFGQQNRAEQEAEKAAAREEALYQQQQQLQSQLGGLTAMGGGNAGPAPSPPLLAGAPPEAINQAMGGPQPSPMMLPPSAPSPLAAQGAVTDDQLQRIGTLMLAKGNPQQMSQGLNLLTGLQGQSYESKQKQLDRIYEQENRQLEQEFRRGERIGSQEFQARQNALNRRQQQQSALLSAAQKQREFEMKRQEYVAKQSEELINQGANLDKSVANFDEIIATVNKTWNNPAWTPLMQAVEGVGITSLTGGDYEKLTSLVKTNVQTLLPLMKGLGAMNEKELELLTKSAPTEKSPDSAFYDYTRRSMNWVAKSYERLAEKAALRGLRDQQGKFMQKAMKAREFEEKMRFLGKRGSNYGASGGAYGPGRGSRYGGR